MKEKGNKNTTNKEGRSKMKDAIMKGIRKQGRTG
jgi:hypothetical protein